MVKKVANGTMIPVNVNTTGFEIRKTLNIASMFEKYPNPPLGIWVYS
jgi:hypothetical protein